ncbi:MAG: hypothetical protein ACI835_002343 [Planctomycetota bacterium]|jgi:hypothetical protein
MALAQGPFDPDVVFSIDANSPTVGLNDSVLSQPITEGDILGPAIGTPTLGPLAAPGIRFEAVADLMLDATGPYEVDALSFGLDYRIPNAAIPAGIFWFSVDCNAVGDPTLTTNPSVLTEGAGVSNREAEADVFIHETLGTAPLGPVALATENVGAIDGNGLANQTGIAYPGVGLLETNLGGIPCTYDNMDALDMHGTGADFGVYTSLAAATASLNGFAPGDVIVSDGVLPPTLYASAADLGLDRTGAATDNLDALILTENGMPGFQVPTGPYDWDTALIGKDMLIFSVDANSAVVGRLDSIFNQPIQPGDLLIPPVAGGFTANPGIFVAAEHLGLRTNRVLHTGDELNAASAREEEFRDCNGNGVDDALDIKRGKKTDRDGNGIPDECEGDDKVELNEIQVTHGGPSPTPETDEFIELIGPSNASLDGHVLLIVDGNLGTAGTLNRAWDLTGLSMPADGYFVIGPAAVIPDFLLTGSDEIDNGSQSFMLIVSPDPSLVLGLIGSDLDANNDGILRFPGNGTIQDAVATTLGIVGTTYVGAYPVIELPPLEGGILRGNDAPNDWCPSAYLDFTLGIDLLATPGNPNVACGIIGYNLDGNANTTFGTPNPAYGAAANQPGNWFEFSAGASGASLLDTNGVASGATISEVGAVGNFLFNNAGTNSNDEALLDDLVDVGGMGGISVITITGLAASAYDVYTYAWNPSAPTVACTDVSVALSVDPAQTVCGAWGGSHVHLGTYALHRVILGAGADVVITVATNSGSASVNGIQIKPVASGQATTYCDPPGANSVSPGGAVLTSTGNFGAANAGFHIASIPNQPGLLYSGPDTILIPFGNGLRCVGGNVTRGGVFFPIGNQVTTTFNMSQLNTINIQCWYRDPMGGGSFFNLSNALAP